MSSQNINELVDQLVDSHFDKISKSLKDKLQKLIIKHERSVIRQFVASQKESSKPVRTTVHKDVKEEKKKRTSNKKLDYSSMSESDYSSDSE